MEEKRIQENDELLKNDNLSKEQNISNENLDLSELEEVAGGVQTQEKQEELKGNGCGSCLGMCG